jgi:hypothetical protein
MKKFIIYDSRGDVWEDTFEFFHDAVEFVSIIYEEQNRMVIALLNDNFDDHIYEAYDNKHLPLKMMKNFTHRDKYGGVKVAYNKDENISTYVREVTV